MRLPKTLWRQSPEFPQLWLSMDKSVVFNETDMYSFNLLKGELLNRPRGRWIKPVTSHHTKIDLIRFKVLSIKGDKFKTKLRHESLDHIYNQTWPEFSPEEFNQIPVEESTSTSS